MSGFFGILRTDGVAAEPRHLDEIAQRLRLRGPDGGQTWAKNGFGTCFSYLETGTRHHSRSQPVGLAERYTLLGEVRLDARKQLIEELQKNKLSAREEASDQELLLLAWSMWSEEALAKNAGRLFVCPLGCLAAIACLHKGFCGRPAIFLRLARWGLPLQQHAERVTA